MEPPPRPRPGAARKRPNAPAWFSWAIGAALGLLLAGLGGAWMAVAHTVPMPAALLTAWPGGAGSAGWAYAGHAVLVMAVPLGLLGWAAGALLQHLVAVQRSAAALRGLALLPWLLACPWLALQWAADTAQPLHTLISLAAGGQLLSAWAALPAGLLWATRRRASRRVR